MASFFGKDADVVSRWVLDATQYKGELKNLAKEVRDHNKIARDAATVQQAMGKSMAETEKSIGTLSKGFNVAATAAKAFGAVLAARQLVDGLDNILTQGARVDNVMRNLPFSLDAASKATKGLATQMSLAEAANRAAALGVEVNEKSFAKLAEAATIMAQKLGTDANKAINDLITGLGRGSTQILDNVGIVLSAEEAYQKFADANNRVAGELTESEKKLAVQQAAMLQLAEKTKTAKVNIDGAGAAWLALKNSLEDSFNAFTSAVSRSQKLAGAIKELASTARRAAGFFGADLLGQDVPATLASLGADLPRVQKKTGVRPTLGGRGDIFGVDVEGKIRERKVEHKPREIVLPEPVPMMTLGGLTPEEEKAKRNEEGLKEAEQKAKNLLILGELAQKQELLNVKTAEANFLTKQAIEADAQLAAQKQATAVAMDQMATATARTAIGIVKATAKGTKAMKAAAVVEGIVQAAIETARAIAAFASQNYGAGALHLSSAALFIVAAAKAGGGGAGGGGVPSRAGGAGGSNFRPSSDFRDREERDKERKVTVQLLIDPQDPASQLIANRKLSAALAGA